MTYKKNILAQSILEYSVIFSIVVAALMAMQYYIKRGIQAATRAAADQLGAQTQPEILDLSKGYLSNEDSTTYFKSDKKTRTHFLLDLQPGMDKQINITETTNTASTAVYNAGEYGTEEE